MQRLFRLEHSGPELAHRLERDRRKASGKEAEQDRCGEHGGEDEGAAQDERADEDDQDGPPESLTVAKLLTSAALSMGRAIMRRPSSRAAVFFEEPDATALTAVFEKRACGYEKALRDLDGSWVA